MKDLTLTHKSKGIYSFQHPACQPKRPFFATLAEDSTIGSVAATITKAGTCSIKTYSSEGKLFDKSFSFWLPDHNKLVWAQLDVAGNIIAKQDFNAPKGRWKSVVRRGIPEFSFVGWRKDHSAFLFNPSSGFGVPGFRESPNNSVYLYLHHPQQKVRVTQPLQILFVP